MKTKIEIIDETVEYYSSNPRVATPNRCYYYLAVNGAMCAVGRCLIDPMGVERKQKTKKLRRKLNESSTLVISSHLKY